MMSDITETPEIEWRLLLLNITKAARDLIDADEPTGEQWTALIFAAVAAERKLEKTAAPDSAVAKTTPFHFVDVVVTESAEGDCPLRQEIKPDFCDTLTPGH